MKNRIGIVWWPNFFWVGVHWLTDKFRDPAYVRTRIIRTWFICIIPTVVIRIQHSYEKEV